MYTATLGIKHTHRKTQKREGGKGARGIKDLKPSISAQNGHFRLW